MENNIMFKRAIVAGFFIIFGVTMLVFIEPTLEMKIFGCLFLFIGGLFFIKSLLSYSKYKKTGKIKPIIDERLELNNLKASKKGFVVLASLIAVLILLKEFEVINETIFVTSIAPIFGLSILIYITFYFYYERKG